MELIRKLAVGFEEVLVSVKNNYFRAFIGGFDDNVGICPKLGYCLFLGLRNVGMA